MDPQDEFGTGPRISARLPAGVHIVETIHRDERTAGGFTLTAAAAASEPDWVAASVIFWGVSAYPMLFIEYGPDQV